jgi:hypothetical protein
VPAAATLVNCHRSAAPTKTIACVSVNRPAFRDLFDIFDFGPKADNGGDKHG